MATLEANIVADGQILENSGHHFTGSANPVSDILLGQFFRDKQRTVAALLSEVRQYIGYATVYILQGQALHIRRELANPLGQVADQFAGDIGVLIQNPVKIVLEDDAEAGFLDRAHRRRA